MQKTSRVSNLSATELPPFGSHRVSTFAVYPAGQTGCKSCSSLLESGRYPSSRLRAENDGSYSLSNPATASMGESRRSELSPRRREQKAEGRCYVRGARSALCQERTNSRDARCRAIAHHSGSPAIRRPSTYLARSSGRRNGGITSLRLDRRSRGSSCRSRSTSFRAAAGRLASA